jgi:hypothetical protein
MVGNTDLCEHTPKYLMATVYSLRTIQRMRLLQLRDKSVRTVNRSGEQSWEEGYVCGKLDKVFAWLYVFPVNLYDIADEFEGKEAHTYRQDDVQRGPCRFQTYYTQQFRKRLCKEIEIFEIQQQTNTETNAQRR